MTDRAQPRPIKPPTPPVAERCPSRFVAWFDGHEHVVQCQKDAGHADEFHNHERRWMDGENV